MTAMRKRSGSRWQKVIEHILRRDNGLCQHCLRNGTIRAASEVDHIKRIADGGGDDDDNLQALCHDCHADKTATEGGKRRKVRIGLDGWPE